MGKTINWKKALWDKLSDEEIRAKVEYLPEKIQAELLKFFGRDELQKMGWHRVCSGCGTPLEKRDCGCPAGTGWSPPKDALK